MECHNIIKTYTIFKILLVFIVFILGIVFIPINLHSAVINVVVTTDQFSNDGQCSLREAVVNANNNNQSGSTDCTAGEALPNIDQIVLQPGTHVLSLSGVNEQFAFSGDLDLLESVQIAGGGSSPTSTIIDGECNMQNAGTTTCGCGNNAANRLNDRLFEIRVTGTHAIIFSNLTLRGGEVL